MNLPLHRVAPEFDLAPRHGFTMHGWDFSRAEVAAALEAGRMLNPAFELGTNACPWNCSFCFTEDPSNPEGRKRRLAGELSLERRLALIDEAAALGARSINIVGAGEPTIDPDFWVWMERIARHGMVPILYTEGTLRLRDRAFAERLHALGATVVLKMNSLFDAAQQDAIVRGPQARKGSVPSRSYTAMRDEVLALLLEVGFADHQPTRLAFDTIVTRTNLDEIERLHRFARERNIFVLLVNYLPSGRSTEVMDDAVSFGTQRSLFSRLAEIDALEYGLEHGSGFPYAGGVPCTIRGLGLYVKIDGSIHDCPGQSMPLGRLDADGGLAAAWAEAEPIRASFDGQCAPRRQFEERLRAARDRRRAARA